MDFWHFHFRNVAFNAGLMEKNTAYTKFIILGTARTGSNYLRGMLNSHRQVVAFGELFRDQDAIGWDFAHLPHSRGMLSLFQNDPTKFLETRVFGNFPKHISAVGFKIFYYHAHDAAREPIWTYLRDHEEIKVIHIKRQNILKSYLSKKRAMMTQDWVRQNPTTKSPNQPILLSYEECVEDFTHTRAWEQQYDAIFQNHEKIDVFYEQLSHDYVSEMRRIQDFLDVSYKPVEPKTVKQSNRPLSSSIANYVELKERFAGTPWQEFFES